MGGLLGQQSSVSAECVAPASWLRLVSRSSWVPSAQSLPGQATELWLEAGSGEEAGIQEARYVPNLRPTKLYQPHS